jgi:hypothetical protein
MNLGYIELKFVGFMKDHYKKFHICTKTYFLKTILEFIAHV